MFRKITGKCKFSKTVKSLDLYYFLFSISRVPMSLFDTGTGRHIEANQAYLNYLGYRKEEILGRTLFELDAFIDMNNALEIINLNSEKNSTNVLNIKTKNGKIKNCIFCSQIINFIGNKISYAILQDIDILKKDNNGHS